MKRVDAWFSDFQMPRLKSYSCSLSLEQLIQIWEDTTLTD